jgi:hypothetical protein
VERRLGREGKERGKRANMGERNMQKRGKEDEKKGMKRKD